jgi:hypothetical protein
MGGRDGFGRSGGTNLSLFGHLLFLSLGHFEHRTRSV